ncbi:MAG: NifB/NifX family molybdenum-iron cluster-binding protein [Campylobacterota bacterium]|nr:NifB/NifX family molybdenum-iron cluster-binding protein [Campylobacterota bacterium]
MIIAVPVKTDRENSAVAPLFGKSKWFAFIEDGNISIEKNEAKGGAAVVAWLLAKGVKSLIIQHMSNPPYQKIVEDGSITVYHAGEARIELDELLIKYDTNCLAVIDESNAEGIIKNNDRKHQNH